MTGDYRHSSRNDPISAIPVCFPAARNLPFVHMSASTVLKDHLPIGTAEMAAQG